MIDQQRRTIRSFVKRHRRLSQAKSRAIEQLWSQYGVNWSTANLDLPAIFGRHAPVVLEIGFGAGESLAEMAQCRSYEDFIGVEVHGPGIGHLLGELAQRDLTNVRVARGDAVELMRHCIADRSLARIQLFFPDPWPKKRHWKRRLVQTEWIALAAKKLVRGGTLHLATDWADYADHMLATVAGEPLLEQTLSTSAAEGKPYGRPETRFERRGRRLGHTIWDLVFHRVE